MLQINDCSNWNKYATKKKIEQWLIKYQKVRILKLK